LTLSPKFWETLPLHKGVRILNRDARGLAALEKPVGTLSHPNKPGEEPRSLLTCPYDEKRECFSWPREIAPDGSVIREAGELFLMNRLDSATSGVLLVVSDEELAKVIRSQFAKRGVSKTYAAMVFGVPRTRRDVWEDRLSVKKKGGQIRGNTHGHIESKSEMRHLGTRAGQPAVSLIELQPSTGRSHQLRLHCQRHALPIVGDATYGDFPRNKAYAKATGVKRLLLHSFHTSVNYTWDGRTYEFEATSPLPPEFSIA